MAESLDHKRKLSKRRRAILANKPDHYCPNCTVLVYSEDAACMECSFGQPESGWPHLRDSMDPWLGRAIENRYLLTKRIGQGASASVYRAESLAISRQFAIKLINPPKGTGGPSAEQIAGRLEREVEAIGRLRNPHVVHFYDVIELPLNHIGVVMDFVEGDTLELEVEQFGVMTVARACSLLRQIANGVYEAHLTGMTHRDLKPENIMIERLPAGDDFVHVLDFGIVHMEGEVNLTQGFIGTPLYASPEQAMGEEVDNRSDIYSLGAITFFMLTGRPPFLGQNVMQVLRQHVEEPPPPLRHLRNKNDVPAALERLILRMLAKSPNDRPQSLAEVIKLLDELFVKIGEENSSAHDRVKVPADQAASQQYTTSPGGAETSPHLDDTPSSPSSTSHGRPRISEAGRLADAGSSPVDGYKNTGDMPPRTLDSLSSVAEEDEDDFHTGSIPGSIVDRSRLQSDTYTRVTPSSGIFGKIRRPHSSPRIIPPEPRHIKDVVESSDSEYGQLSLEEFGQPSVYALGPEHCVLSLTDGALHLWRLQPQRHKSFVIEHPEQITALAMSRKNALIGRASGVIELLDLKTGHITELFRSVFSDAVQALTIDQKGSVMMAVMHSGRIYMSGAQRDNSDWVRVRGGTAATTIRLDQKNDLFAIARQSGQVEIARISAPKQVRIEFSTPMQISHIAFSEDGYLIGLMEHEGQRVSLYQVINGKHLVDVSTEGHALLAMGFSSDNELLGYLKNERHIFVRNLQALS